MRLRNGVSQRTAGYSFDATGNTRQSYEQPLVFDAATDRLVSRVTSSGTHYYRYDRAGNLVTDSVPGVVVMKLNYDALDRLVSGVRQPGVQGDPGGLSLWVAGGPPIHVSWP